jgi:hypothetical protein
MDVARQVSEIITSPGILGAGDSGFGPLQMLMLAGGVLGLGIVMRSTYRRVSESRRQPRDTAREMYRDLSDRSEARRDVEQVMLELDALARQIHGRIDTRIAKLESIIKDADERIDKLSRLGRKAEGRSTVDVTVGGDAHYEAAVPARSPAVPQGAGADCNDRQTAIYGLADAGMTASQISEKLGHPVGEVELIIALRKTRLEAAGRSGRAHSGPNP